MPLNQDSSFSVSSESLLKETKELRSFIDILKKEELALVQGKIDEIDFYASDKLRSIEILIQLNDQREEYFKAQGLTLDKSCINNWLRKQQNSDQTNIIEIWNELLDLAKTAQRINQSNGLIISTRHQHHQRALAALHSAAGNVSCYGPKGQAYI